jgi:hypothetical protein
MSEKSRPNPIMKFFSYQHLPPKLGEVSMQFSILADYIAENCPPCAETSVALRKRLEAKDAAVRSQV